MAYSLRTRSASATETPTVPMKKAAVKKTPAAPKKAVISARKKSEEPAIVEVKTASPTVKAAVKKAVAAKKSAKAAPKAKAPARKAVKEKKVNMAAPVVTIEEFDEELQSPLMPEIEPISHYEAEKEQAEEVEKVFEMVEGQVVNTHIRFSDAEESETEEEMNPAVNNSADFEALDGHEPEHFELYNSEESEVEAEICETKEMSLVPSAHEDFNHSESESEVAKIDEIPLVSSPVVISNPFGFGFTATTDAAADALNILSDSAVNFVSKPNPYSFNSHFQSVSSPLDKLCNLTSQSNPIAISRTFGLHDDNSSSIMATSYLPTSPVAGMRKASRSSSENGDEREARSPSAIQSIIVDDKHEDFSAF